jgi:hypothetical protein
VDGVSTSEFEKFGGNVLNVPSFDEEKVRQTVADKQKHLLALKTALKEKSEKSEYKDIGRFKYAGCASRR